MKSSQWYLIGIFLMVMSFWFIRLDLTYNIFCMSSYGQETISAIDVQACTKSEVYAPLIWLLFPLGWVFVICGWIESHSKKKEEKEKFREIMDRAKDEDFAMKVAQKLKLKHLPKNVPELVYWGKKEGKEKEVDEAITEKTERWLLSLELFKEKNKYKRRDIDKDWIAKMKKKYPDEKPYEFADYEV